LIEQASGRIIATAFCAGRRHDFKLLVQSRTALLGGTRCLAESGYLGLTKRHANSQT